MAKGKSNKFYAKILLETVKDLKPAQIKIAVKNFATFLIKENKVKKIDQIIEEFERYAKSSEGIQEVKITLAKKGDLKTVEKIKNSLAGKIEETIIIDESILGGFILQTDDKIIDASLKTQLLNLKQSFN
ncbi:MAG TPA: F0F1 ATP synthase subunit delta [Candidatus Magasanikbacteria bacterium]|nr:F0F1 ATP synthase subunit delta [Candidatus Magasanikbacteria bacterium]